MRRIRTAVCGIALSLMASFAMALDAGEIIQMVQNNINDSTIINMVNSQKLARPLTPNEVVALNAAGASPVLLEHLTRPDAVASYQSTTRVVTSPSTIVSEPTTIVEQPTTVVTAPPTVVYTQPQTVYYQSYPYYYSYPYRSYYYRPGVNLNFSFGSRHRWHGGGPRGHHRPGRR